MAKDRRRKILKAAESLLGNRRFHEVTMDDVAQAAGVGKGTIYRYFENKDTLFSELVGFGFDELYEKIRSTPIASGSFVENLTGICTCISGFFDKRTALMRVMNEAQDREACAKRRFRQDRRERRERLNAEVARWLEEGVRCGELRDDVPLEQQALYLLTMLGGRSRHSRFHDTEVPMEHLIALFLDGCRARRRV